MIQVSERQFFTDFAENTTRLELYNDHTANIFLNNNTSADHFIRFGNDTGFENKLDAYPFEVLHKVAYFKHVLQSFWIIALFAMLRYSGRLIGVSRSIYTEDKVKTRLKDVAGLEHQKQEIAGTSPCSVMVHDRLRTGRRCCRIGCSACISIM